MHTHRSILAPVVLAFLALACSDAPSTAPRANALPVSDASLSLFEHQGNEAFHRYVAIGTSVSMGWQSDGAIGSGQRESWPAQLARLAGGEMTQPYIDGTGCRSPLAAPLASGARLSGEAAGASAGSFSCAPLQAGVTLPTANVAIAAATTRDALQTTPETQTDPFYSKLYPRILPPGSTQLSAALSQKPRFVSVELGANEVLGARSGVAMPGVTLFPVDQWKPLYNSVVDAVDHEAGRGVLVGLIRDVGSFPSFRRGAELYADRGAFLAAFNVAVGTDCDGSDNLVFVPVRVPTAVATGLYYRANGYGTYTMSCADGGTGVQDFVLTPAEAATVNATMADMNRHIYLTALQHGFAHFQLDALYGRSDLKPPFSVVELMTSAQPYGPYISLDGLHPSATGHAVLAAAAAHAINRRYRFHLQEPSVLVASR